MDENCTFCKIVAGEIPSAKVYEDDTHLAFLDIQPVNKGHTLIITKKHYKNILETPETELTGILEIAKKTCAALQNEFGYENFNIHQSNGVHANQDVEHIHFHVWPRTENDEFKSIVPNKAEYADGEMKTVAEKLSNHITK